MPALRLLVPVLVVAAAVASSAAASRVVHVTIRHQTVGCHAWSIDNGPFRAALAVAVPARSAIEFTNDDLMVHRLVQVSGPRLALPPALVPGTFHHPGGGNATLVFTRPGTYVLRTVDTPAGPNEPPTTGPDNALRLTVHVSA
jgi:hypothetical protein